MRQKLFLYCSILFSSLAMYGQVNNDVCAFSTFIPNVDHYCSDDGQFTNVGATADPQFSNGCISLNWQNGVWFSFVPREPAALIRVFGFGEGGTMRSPKILIFSSCNQFLQCSPGKTVGVDEMTIDNLNVGQVYYIMVESSVDGQGTFRLCIDDFVPTPTPESDCDRAVVLCDKSAFIVDALSGIGQDRNEIEPSNCIGEEFQSSWYKWTCEQSGTLTFTLTPNNYRGPNFITDDLDFAIYELPNGIDDCNGKQLVRCMASGANGDGQGNTLPLSQWVSCNGLTGLRAGETDEREDPGCRGNSNNFIAPLDMVAGRSYALIINNFSRSGLGFGIEFGGTGTFLGPKPDFETSAIQSFECDKTIIFNNTSESLTDPIVDYFWNFGDRSNPQSASGLGPHNVVYASFGDKIAALTVTSSRGCTVTKIVDFFVQACCQDTSTLGVDALVTDLRCHNLPEGFIEGLGISGAPEYSFQLNQSPFQPNPRFVDLDAGEYQLVVRDIKGCTDTTAITINQPPPLSLDAVGPDEIDLGDSTSIFIDYFSFNGVDSIIIDPDFTSQNGLLQYNVFPNANTTYTVTLIDTLGCVTSTQVTIRVVKDERVVYPNIFSPFKNNINDYFNIWLTKSAKYLELLEIYDRWGNMVYRGVDSRISGGNHVVNTDQEGWDGRFNGRNVETGVYAWRARIRFLDDSIKDFSGDVTVIR